MVNSLCMIGFKYIKACHKLFKWVKQHLMITNSISTSCSINIFYKCQHAHCQERNISDLLEFLGIEPEEAYMKDRIFLNPGEINRIVEASERILAETGLFYQRAGRVVAVYPQQGAAALKEVNIHDLTLEMAKLSRWQRYDYNCSTGDLPDSAKMLFQKVTARISNRTIPIIIL